MSLLETAAHATVNMVNNITKNPAGLNDLENIEATRNTQIPDHAASLITSNVEKESCDSLLQ